MFYFFITPANIAGGTEPKLPQFVSIQDFKSAAD